jgi:serine/threonine protein kinase
VTQLSESQDQIVCPSCESPVDPQAVVCAVCGAVLAAGIESEQATQLLQQLRNALQGRYVLGTAIGLGRAGITLRARRQSGTSRDVAIKVAWDDPNARRDLVREAELSAQVVHPNVIAMTRLDVPPPLVAVEMPLIEGGTLGDLIDSGNATSYQRVIEIVKGIGGALDEAHDRGIIHGALRPEKIHLDRDGNALISGFMLGQFPSGDRDAPLPNTIGSPAYTAFEQRHNLQTIDGRADQFSLAVMTYELLCGKRTWRIPSDGVLEIDAIEIVPHRAIAPSVPLSAGAAIKRATWKDPSYRYDSVKDFIAGLTGTALEGTPSEQLARVDHSNVKTRSPLWILVPLAALIALAAGIRPDIRKTATKWWHAAFTDNALFRVGGNDNQGPSIDVTTTQAPGAGEKPGATRNDVGSSPRGTKRVSDSASYAGVGDRPDRTIDPYPKSAPQTRGTTGYVADDPRRGSTEAPRTIGTARVMEPIGIAPRRSGQGSAVSTGEAVPVRTPRDSVGKSAGAGQRPVSPTQAGDATKAPLMGFLSIAIKSGDTNTVVFLDGQRLGKAPLVWKATPGRHVVSVQRAGTRFAPASMPVTVTLHDTVRAVFAAAASVPKD